MKNTQNDLPYYDLKTVITVFEEFLWYQNITRIFQSFTKKNISDYIIK